MMTVGQHDSAWLNVMNREIPNGVEYVKILAVELRRANTKSVIKELKTAGLMTDEAYYKSMLNMLEGMGQEVSDEWRKEIEEKFGNK